MFDFMHHVKSCFPLSHSPSPYPITIMRSILKKPKTPYEKTQQERTICRCHASCSVMLTEFERPMVKWYLSTIWCLSCVLSFWKLSQLAKAIDQYIELHSGKASAKKIDHHLQDIIEGIFRWCIDDGEHKQVSRTILLILQFVHKFAQAISIQLPPSALPTSRG